MWCRNIQDQPCIPAVIAASSSWLREAAQASSKTLCRYAVPRSQHRKQNTRAHGEGAAKVVLYGSVHGTGGSADEQAMAVEKFAAARDRVRLADDNDIVNDRVLQQRRTNAGTDSGDPALPGLLTENHRTLDVHGHDFDGWMLFFYTLGNPGQSRRRTDA